MKVQTGLILGAMLIGVILLLSALFLDHIWLEPFSRVVALPTTVSREIARDFTTRTSCPSCLPGMIERRVRIEAPGEMRIDESVSAKFRYSEGLSDNISSDFSVTLSGANFDVRPQETQKVVHPKTKLVTLVWTIKPKGTGNHVITVDFSQLVENKLKGDIQVVTTIAGKETPAPPAEAILEVPVRVLTEWGVPNWTVVLFKAMLGFIGFVFVTPGVWWLMQFLRSRFFPPKRTIKPEGHRKEHVQPVAADI